MKIIKAGKQKVKYQRFECDKCGCVFEATEKEFTSGEDRGEFYHKSKCPCCKNPIYKSGDVPASRTKLDLTK